MVNYNNKDIIKNYNNANTSSPLIPIPESILKGLKIKSLN